jgi:hypothetical protein
MPTWKLTYPTLITFTIRDSHATYLKEGEAPQNYTTKQLQEEKGLLGKLLKGFEFEAQLEVEAVLQEESLPLEQRTPAPNISLQGRSSVSRYFSDNMGRGASNYNVWIMGREAWIDVKGQARLTLALSELAKGKLPGAQGSVLGFAANELFDAAQKLSPLPCFCGTGAETPEQHGTIDEIISSRQHPDATCDHLVTIGRCSVCYRGYTFTKSGDSHYSYSFYVRDFPPT